MRTAGTIPHYGVMREEDIIFMSYPYFPHASCPSSSDFPSFPVINITSVPSHENTPIVTKPDPSSMSPLKSSSVAPQDCPSSSELPSSMSLLNFPSHTECSSSTPFSSRSQDSCSPQSLENHSSIPDYADFTLGFRTVSLNQTEYSPSLSLNGTSTFHTLSHSLSQVNFCSTTDPLSFSSTSPLKCSCQPESSTTSCQNPTAIPQMMYSSLSTQSCKSISKETQSECSSMPQINGTSASRTIGQSVSPLDLSSCYFTPPTEHTSDFSPISISDSSKLSVHVGSSTSVLNCQPANQYVKSISDDCSPVDIPCVCTCEFPTDFPPEISSSHLTYCPCSPLKNDNHVSSSVAYSSLNHFEAFCLSLHETPCILQSKDYSDLSNNITPINGIIPPHMNATTDPRGTFTSTKCNSTNMDPLSPWSTQSFQSLTSPEIDVVSTNDQLSNDHLPLNGQYFHPCSCSLPNSVDSLNKSKVLNSSFSTNTPPTPNFICPNSTNQTVSTSTHERHPKMLSSCPHIFPSEETPKYLPFPEEENQVQECEVCKASLENKVRMDQDRQLCENFLDSLSRFEDWLQIAQITTSQGNPYRTVHQEAKLALRKYEVLLTDIREKLLDLESLNRQYWRVAQTAQPMLLPSVLRSRMQEVNTLWDSLQGEAETLHRTLKSRVQQREEFETDQDDMKLCLTEMDLELSNVEYIYGGNSTEKIQQLKAFQEDVWSNMKRVEGLLERGDQLMDNSDPLDAVDLEVEMTELGSYCQQIYIRLSRLQKRLVSTKLVFEDDFLDGAIEHLSSGSSDVFLDLDLEDGEVSSPINDPSTSEALPVDLEWDPLGDVGRSSSHDGQESFYTATSAPWKLPQTSEGSRSSLSSYSGITYSNMRRQQVKEPLDDIHTNHAPPLDSCHLEWTEEQTHGQRWMETTSARHSSLLHLETGMAQDIKTCSGKCPTGMKYQADSEYRMDNHFALHGYSWNAESPLISHVEMTDSRSQPNCSGQRRRPRKKKRAAKNQDTKGTLKPTKPDVSILMENGDDLSHLDLQETSYKPSCSLCVWIRRLVFASILFLVLVTSFFFPWDHQTCPSKSFSWSLMLTYVNGPPPT
ncbi:uncharacterized protein LOC121009620 isoform X3 [Bufo bufo]|uniref:uncharacterized protein LOC121009620 isoform X3 n=1 Tax=Bufo bufo TaxID=8384 RepID=UPI001ABEAC06|nr:uncharacterized protein LOC121009620 isoform X3 [Bufo bufo]